MPYRCPPFCVRQGASDDVYSKHMRSEQRSLAQNGRQPSGRLALSRRAALLVARVLRVLHAPRALPCAKGQAAAGHGVDQRLPGRLQMSRGGMQRLLLVLFTAFAVGHASADADAPFLCQVHGPKATHYLLGSVHLLPSEAEDLPVGIEDAYDAAEGVVFETDIAAIEQPQVQVAMLAAARSQQGLKAEIGERMYAQLGRHAARIGMPVSACDPFRAWFCAMTLEVFSFRKAGFSGENGIDKQVYRWAREDGKSLRWFEQPAAHIGLFTGMSEALSRDFLASSLDDRLGGSSDDPAEL